MGAGKGGERKQQLLRSEGVPVADGRVMDLGNVLFDHFCGEPILETMAQAQRQLAALVESEGNALAFERVAGLDVSYEGDRAFAAMVVLDRQGEVLEERLSECQVNFPYVPGYLGFREMRPYSLLLEEGRQDILYLIDGHGRAHPRRAGVACQFGVVHGVASAGAAKSVLAGERQENSLLLDGEEVGRVVQGPTRSRFLSVGHRADLDSVCQLFRSLPRDPLALAHQRCNRARLEAVAQ